MSCEALGSLYACYLGRSMLEVVLCVPSMWVKTSMTEVAARVSSISELRLSDY